jgi:predicted nuclease of predicted toxin-antitoxin system
MTTFFIDESTPAQTVKFLQDLGYEIIKVKDVGLRGAKNSEIFDKAQELGVCLITADLDFGDIRVYPPSSHHGIIVLRVSPKDFSEELVSIHKILERFLAEETAFDRTLFIVDR